MSDLSRREFVAAATVACGCCMAGLPTSELEAAEAPAGGTGDLVDVGAVADYAKDGVNDTFAKANKLLVVRHGNRLYAPTAVCPHKSCTVKLNRSAKLACPCHGSVFSSDGVPASGPARQPLARHGISVNDQGRLIVDKSRRFAQDKWDDAGSFVEVT